MLNQISDSFRKFGLADTDTSMFVVIVNDTDGATCQAVTSKVKGQLTDIAEVGKYSDLPTIKKVGHVSRISVMTSSTMCTLEFLSLRTPL
jgi:hypothetical protein